MEAPLENTVYFYLPWKPQQVTANLSIPPIGSWKSGRRIFWRSWSRRRGVCMSYPEHAAQAGTVEARKFSLRSTDLETLLVSFLAELLYYQERG